MAESNRFFTFSTDGSPADAPDKSGGGSDLGADSPKNGDSSWFSGEEAKEIDRRVEGQLAAERAKRAELEKRLEEGDKKIAEALGKTKEEILGSLSQANTERVNGELMRAFRGVDFKSPEYRKKFEEWAAQRVKDQYGLETDATNGSLMALAQRGGNIERAQRLFGGFLEKSGLAKRNSGEDVMPSDRYTAPQGGVFGGEFTPDSQKRRLSERERAQAVAAIRAKNAKYLNGMLSKGEYNAFIAEQEKKLGVSTGMQVE